MIDIIGLYLIPIPALAFCFGIFGCFSTWEKQSFFGHTFAHSLLFPLSIAMLCNSFHGGFILMLTIIFAVFFVLVLSYLLNHTSNYYNQDTLLIIISFFCMSGAFVINSISKKHIDLMMLLAGDILFIDNIDIAFLYILSIAVLLYLMIFYRILVLRAISFDLAVSDNKKINIINTIFLILQACFIAISVRAVGVLLVSATLLMPAIIARIFCKSPLQMLFGSVFVGFFVMVCSSCISILLNLNFAPVVIILYCVIFCLVYFAITK